jgi:hypothetical protein
MNVFESDLQELIEYAPELLCLTRVGKLTG